MHICTRWFVCRRIQCSLFSSLSLHSSLSHCVGVLVLCNILVSHQWKNNNRHSLNVLAFCKQHADTHTHTHINVKRLFVVRAIISILHASLKTAFGIASLLWTLARFTAHLTEFSTAICALHSVPVPLRFVILFMKCEYFYREFSFSLGVFFSLDFCWLSLSTESISVHTLSLVSLTYIRCVYARIFSFRLSCFFFSSVSSILSLCWLFHLISTQSTMVFFLSNFGSVWLFVFFCLCHQIFGGSLSKNEHNRFELGIVVSLKWLFFLLVFCVISRAPATQLARTETCTECKTMDSAPM